mmetsp:Transcript_59775/g.118429  ORF Transcript_59775/g.118429 Transcript_59775/m.118429 type:complete len:278 (+) Transcript_59775:919-1752(+)
MATNVRWRSAFSLASSSARQARSSSTFFTSCARFDTSLVVPTALFIACSIPSAKCTNLPDRSFIWADAADAPSKPLLRAFSIVANRNSHCSERLSRSPVWYRCCSLMCACRAARAVFVLEELGAVLFKESAASSWSACAADKRAAAKSRPKCEFEFSLRGSTTANLWELCKRAAVCLQAPCTATVWISISCNIACLSLESPPGERAPTLAPCGMVDVMLPAKDLSPPNDATVPMLPARFFSRPFALCGKMLRLSGQGDWRPGHGDLEPAGPAWSCAM